MTPKEILEVAQGLKEMSGPAFEAAVQYTYVNALVAAIACCVAFLVGVFLLAAGIWFARRGSEYHVPCFLFGAVLTIFPTFGLAETIPKVMMPEGATIIRILRSR
ncbi:MAG: hypothetical protein A3E78_09255 [Alphaproteobacteria bacterium RIFCSPHIGHO2_12_FULL_63_12]|nr:MAG: hypothetical protein A3E78_09255 [Alphaproteobacteria bacterium RIFCSPHIGHO2_12_FULL_63_12]